MTLFVCDAGSAAERASDGVDVGYGIDSIAIDPLSVRPESRPFNNLSSHHSSAMSLSSKAR